MDKCRGNENPRTEVLAKEKDLGRDLQPFYLLCNDGKCASFNLSDSFECGIQEKLESIPPMLVPSTRTNQVSITSKNP